ncbi:hypothetical protein BDP55DRAFT_632497 [Colletotrichum godetiae]|uniref:Uncharacterized protein n=1 Tax=Colletotrichum godetiae TaxID=1209918 RepID=A0AAJ0ESR3_9PEZI|nr:uncharacterized protein BDP55DRAFT_632497 [Colletotrichum godetiae]KAK1675336.1 hypothetical protein BDP55DRAFT_632497 [Colletotrichum godetiae]
MAHWRCMSALCCQPQAKCLHLAITVTAHNSRASEIVQPLLALAPVSRVVLHPTPVADGPLLLLMQHPAIAYPKHPKNSILGTVQMQESWKLLCFMISPLELSGFLATPRVLSPGQQKSVSSLDALLSVGRHPSRSRCLLVWETTQTQSQPPNFQLPARSPPPTSQFPSSHLIINPAVCVGATTTDVPSLISLSSSSAPRGGVTMQNSLNPPEEKGKCKPSCVWMMMEHLIPPHQTEPFLTAIAIKGSSIWPGPPVRMDRQGSRVSLEPYPGRHMQPSPMAHSRNPQCWSETPVLRHHLELSQLGCSGQPRSSDQARYS